MLVGLCTSLSDEETTMSGRPPQGKGSRVADGILLGALAGAALYLGWKTNTENRKVTI